MSCFSLTSFLKLIPPFYLELFLYSIQFYSSVYSFRVEVSLAVIFFLVFILIVIGWNISHPPDLLIAYQKTVQNDLHYVP